MIDRRRLFSQGNTTPVASRVSFEQLISETLITLFTTRFSTMVDFWVVICEPDRRLKITVVLGSLLCSTVDVDCLSSAVRPPVDFIFTTLNSPVTSPTVSSLETVREHLLFKTLKIYYLAHDKNLFVDDFDSYQTRLF